MIVYAIIDARSSSTSSLGDAIETFIRREDAERFVEEVRGDEPELASYLRVRRRAAGVRWAELPSTKKRPRGQSYRASHQFSAFQKRLFGAGTTFWTALRNASTKGTW
jgi:hypothetical protein